MSVHHHENSSLTGLARRWLKSQLQVHGNPQRAHSDRQEAEAIEYEMREQASDQIGRAVFNAVLPAEWKRKLTALDEQRVEQEQSRAAKRLAEQKALPRTTVSLSFRGAIHGVVSAQLPVRIDWPGSEGAFTIIEVEPIEPISVEGRAFHGMRIALPACDANSGNPVNLARAVHQHARHWDPLDAQVWFDDADDPFFWSEDYGNAHFWPAPGLQMVQFLMPIQNAAGERVSIEGTLSFDNFSEN